MSNKSRPGPAGKYEAMLPGLVAGVAAPADVVAAVVGAAVGAVVGAVVGATVGGAVAPTTVQMASSHSPAPVKERDLEIGRK